MKVALGLPKLQKRVHHLPKVKTKLLTMHLYMTTKNLEDKKCLKNLALHLKANSLEEKQLQDGTKVPGMEMDLTVTLFLVLILVIRLWIIEEVVEETMTRLDVGHMTELGMLLLTITH